MRRTAAPGPPGWGLGEGLISLPCEILNITETASTFQELYVTEEEIGQVPQDCDIVFTDYQSRMVKDTVKPADR